MKRNAVWIGTFLFVAISGLEAKKNTAILEVEPAILSHHSLYHSAMILSALRKSSIALQTATSQLDRLSTLKDAHVSSLTKQIKTLTADIEKSIDSFTETQSTLQKENRRHLSLFMSMPQTMPIENYLAIKNHISTLTDAIKSIHDSMVSQQKNIGDVLQFLEKSLIQLPTNKHNKTTFMIDKHIAYLKMYHTIIDSARNLYTGMLKQMKQFKTLLLRAKKNSVAN